MSVYRNLSPAKRIARLALPVSSICGQPAGRMRQVGSRRLRDLSPVGAAGRQDRPRRSPLPGQPDRRAGGSQRVARATPRAHSMHRKPATQPPGVRASRWASTHWSSRQSTARTRCPEGGAADLTDTEVARAVAYLGNQAGAKVHRTGVSGSVFRDRRSEGSPFAFGLLGSGDW